MNNDINLVLPVAVPLPVASSGGSKQSAKLKGEYSFLEAVRKELQGEQGVKLSAHAEKRLQERNITLAQTDLDKISGAIKEAALKGARESLIIYDGLALITNVRSKTVVTAMDSLSGTTQVFTNIDSAVVLS